MNQISLRILSMTNTSLGREALRSKEGIEVSDFNETHISFLMPKPIHEGNLVTLECKLEILEETHPLPITGKISACTPVATGEFNVTISLRQVEKVLWAKFIKLTRESQAEADRLFTAMKGEE